MYLEEIPRINLEDILVTERPIYAHRNMKEGKARETLQEHTGRCETYFTRLFQKGMIEETFLSLEEELLAGIAVSYRRWFRQALYGVVSFHDTGKINPLFQEIKMKNPAFKDIRIPTLQEDRHSLLSACIYLDFFLARLEQLGEQNTLERREKVILYDILLLNAYVISRHHSSLDDTDEFYRKLEEGGRMLSICDGMERGEYGNIYRGKFSRTSWAAVRRSQTRREDTENRKFARFLYVRLVFSLLTASDYYATNEYIHGTQMTEFGGSEPIRDINRIYEQTERVRRIRQFEAVQTPDDGKDTNYLRDCMFCEAEKNLLQSSGDNIFFLEAPTGSGKSNVAFNCSFKLLEQGMDKIVYVYPFNNLVEQNRLTLKELFGGEKVLDRMAVLNSITPIKRERLEREARDEQDENPEYYQKALLDRQFWNYPLILTTHVNLFQTVFGTEREAVFGFHQLAGSVLVLDEIQSYKNVLWTEIMKFLQACGRFLHCKILIMSATLPDFIYLTGRRENVRRLITDREKYFRDCRFKDRVKVSYELLQEDFSMEVLCCHVKRQAKEKKKILIEFIKKDMAYEFYDRLAGSGEITASVERMTGDDNAVDRELILTKVKDSAACQEGIILVATQVVEAGIDIDMDIGYKDISILDSEEQFMGRINRNCRRGGIVYFFNLCDAAKIYRQDFRVNREFTLENPKMRSVLAEKQFDKYYGPVLKVLKENWNASTAREGIDFFLREEVGPLKFCAIEKRMRLIEESDWNMSVFLAREIADYHGQPLDGRDVWAAYKQILTNPPDDYAEFRVKLSDITSRLNLFIYQINKNSDIAYHDRIGELYYIENGEAYFEKGRLDKKKLTERGALFLDW